MRSIHKNLIDALRCPLLGLFLLLGSSAQAQLQIPLTYNWRPPVAVPEVLVNDPRIQYAGLTQWDQQRGPWITYNIPKLAQPPETLLFLRVHEYGHVVLKHTPDVYNAQTAAQLEGAADCWAGKQLWQSDPEILKRVLYLFDMLGNTGGDQFHGTGAQMAAWIRSCVANLPNRFTPPVVTTGLPIVVITEGGTLPPGDPAMANKPPTPVSFASGFIQLLETASSEFAAVRYPSPNNKADDPLKVYDPKIILEGATKCATHDNDPIFKGKYYMCRFAVSAQSVDLHYERFKRDIQKRVPAGWKEEDFQIRVRPTPLFLQRTAHVEFVESRSEQKDAEGRSYVLEGRRIGVVHMGRTEGKGYIDLYFAAPRITKK